MTERIRAALNAAKAARQAGPRWDVQADGATLNVTLVPPVEEISLIEAALSELTMLEIGHEDLLGTPRCATCDDTNLTGA